MKVVTIVTGPFQENSYLVQDEATGEAALVDPGADAPVLIDAIRQSGATLRAIWLTHAHVDHIGAIAGVKRVWDVPVHMHADDLPLYRNGAAQAAHFGLGFEQPPDPDVDLEEDLALPLGQLRFKVMHAPGHSPGHVVIHGHGAAFVGDCLFAGSVGRTDLPLSNAADLRQTLSRIAALPAATRVLPGHGPATTVGKEVQSNPFLVGLAPEYR